MGKLHTKICGMRDPANIAALLRLPVDYIGLIFYPASPRYVSTLDPEIFAGSTVKKVGVFVNATPTAILTASKRYDLDAIQLHGTENAACCADLKAQGLQVWKAFGLHDHFDFKTLTPYSDVVDHFLFDTRSDQHGGSGHTFAWSLLDQYQGLTPYWLSGGIGPDNLPDALLRNDRRQVGIDFNSKLEITPGVKNLTLVKEVLNIIHHEYISGR